MKGKKKKTKDKSTQNNNETKICIQDLDEEKWICMQSEAYYRAMKRIDNENTKKLSDCENVEIQNDSANMKCLYKILYILNFLLCPFKISGRVKLKEGVYNLPIVFAVSLIMWFIGLLSWLFGLLLIPYSIILEKIPFDIALVPVAVISVFIGSMLIVGAQEFEKEEDNNQIYAFSATFLALVSLCVSIASFVR